MGMSYEREGRFLSHQPCLKCGSKDNLATYSDGHSYCFGCHYYIPAHPTLQRFRIKEEVNSNSLVSLPHDYTLILPTFCQLWLKQYELTNKEVDDLEAGWSESTGLLLFPIKKENTLLGYVGRRFKGEGSKYTIKGEKKHFGTVYGSGSTLVVTEDLISAIKVARVTSALSLFGTFLNSIPEGYESYRLWLDKDKQISSLQQCKKWRQFGYDIKPIVTELDPKEYNSHQIKEFIEK